MAKLPDVMKTSKKAEQPADAVDTKDAKPVAQTKDEAKPGVAAEDTIFAIPEGIHPDWAPGGRYYREKIPPITSDDLDARMQAVMKAVEDLKEGVTPPYTFGISKDHKFQMADYSGAQLNELIRVGAAANSGIRFQVMNYLMSLKVSEKNRLHELDMSYTGESTSPLSTIYSLQKVVGEKAKYWKMLDEMEESDIRLEKINKILMGNFLGLQEYEQYDTSESYHYESAETVTDRAFDEFCNSLVRVGSLVRSFYSTHRGYQFNSIDYAVPVATAKDLKNPFFTLACASSQLDLLRSFHHSVNQAVANRKLGRANTDTYLIDVIGKDLYETASDEIVFADGAHDHYTTGAPGPHDITRPLGELRRVIVREISKGKRVYSIIGMMIENIVSAASRVAQDTFQRFGLWVRAYDRAGLDITEIITRALTTRSDNRISDMTSRTTRYYDCPF